MGGPGDEWVNDLRMRDRLVFSEHYDRILRDILRSGGERELTRSPWFERLWAAFPMEGEHAGRAHELDEYAEELHRLRDSLQRNDVTRGSDGPEAS